MIMRESYLTERSNSGRRSAIEFASTGTCGFSLFGNDRFPWRKMAVRTLVSHACFRSLTDQALGGSLK